MVRSTPAVSIPTLCPQCPAICAHTCPFPASTLVIWILVPPGFVGCEKGSGVRKVSCGRSWLLAWFAWYAANIICLNQLIRRFDVPPQTVASCRYRSQQQRTRPDTPRKRDVLVVCTSWQRVQGGCHQQPARQHEL